MPVCALDKGGLPKQSKCCAQPDICRIPWALEAAYHVVVPVIFSASLEVMRREKGDVGYFLRSCQPAGVSMHAFDHIKHHYTFLILHTRAVLYSGYVLFGQSFVLFILKNTRMKVLHTNRGFKMGVASCKASYHHDSVLVIWSVTSSQLIASFYLLLMVNYIWYRLRRSSLPRA